MSLEILEVPTEWFDGERYRPRLSVEGGSRWFLLEEPFRPVTEVPVEPPEEPVAGRDELDRAFRETCRQWGLASSSAAEDSLAKLRSPGSAVIVAGQQPGLLGGPLLTLYKALTAIAAARTYEANAGRPCVPVFWVAGEDHDLDEVRSAHFPGSGGEDATFTYEAPMDRRPVADYRMDETNLPLLEALRSAFSQRRFGDLATDIVELYRGRNLAAGFAAVMNRLLGDTGLVLIDPARLRPLVTALWQRVIESPDEILAALEQGREEVQARGIQPFVSARLPLFLLVDGKRHHLEPHAGGFRVSGGGPAFGRDELIARVSDDPFAFSAGALLRPLVQQFTLPCVLTIGGPAEVGYFSQLAPLASALGVTRPRIALRLGATLLDGQGAKASRRYAPLDLARASSAEGLLVAGETPPGVDAVYALADRAGGELAKAASELAGGTPDEKRLAGRAEKIERDIRGFGDRLAKAWAQANAMELARAQKLWNQVFPGGVLQERRWNALHFVSKHGTEWIGELLQSLADDPLKIRHWFVTFERQ